MFEFLLDATNYASRKVGRDKITANLGISTAYTSDEGYETAIIDCTGVHPVERYSSKRLAAEGHAKWVKFAKTAKPGQTVTKLGGFDGLVADTEVQLSF